MRRGRDNHPGNRIAEEKRENAACETENNGEQPDDRWVEIQILAQPAAQPGNFFVGFGTIQAFHGIALSIHIHLYLRRITYFDSNFQKKKPAETDGLVETCSLCETHLPFA